MTINQRHADRIAPLVTPAAEAVAAGRHAALAQDSIGVDLTPAEESPWWTDRVAWASIAVIAVCAGIVAAIFISKVAGA